MKINSKNKKGKGSILVVSLVFLFVLAGLSVMVLSTTSSEKRMAHNDEDYLLAKQSAETAVGTAIQSLIDTWNVGIAECTAVGCACPSGSICVWDDSVFDGIDMTQQTASWWNSYATTISKSNPALFGGPQYIIIDLGCDQINCNNIFRIITRGVGGSQQSVAFSDVTYAMPLSNQNITTSQTTNVYGQVNGLIQQNFVMSPSTVSGPFYNSGTCSSGGTNAYCQLNCVGLVRVVAWTTDNNNGCTPYYGPWANGTSSVQVYDHPKNPVISCFATNTTICYNKHGKQKKCKN